MTIEMVAFDADDTLWHMEIHFKEAQEKFSQIVSHWQDPETIQDILLNTETNNITHYGFGVKSYTLSMIETALQLSDGEISGKAIKEILEIGRILLDSEVTLIPGIKETLTSLVDNYPLMVITKGDLLEQTLKIKRSGLGDFFSIIEVVSHKTKHAYHEILKKLDLDPSRFVMVGNSLPSDIQPILSLGGIGVHIPANTTWAHEMMDDFDDSQENFYEIEHIGQLPDLLAEIN